MCGARKPTRNTHGHPGRLFASQFFATNVHDFDVTFPVCIGLTLVCLALLG